MKWLLTTFIALLVLTALQPWLSRLGIGRLPGDMRFKRNGREYVLPFTSTIVLSLLLMLVTQLLAAQGRRVAALPPPRPCAPAGLRAGSAWDRFDASWPMRSRQLHWR